MRILFLTSSMHAGGAERVASTLANAWASRGDEVILMPTFSGGGHCFYELAPRIQLVYLTSVASKLTPFFGGRIARLFALRSFIRSTQPDVIVSFLSNVNIAAVIACVGMRIPVAVCERSDPFVMPVSRLLRCARAITYPLATTLVVQTEAVARKYLSAFFPLARVRVVPNPAPQHIVNIHSNFNLNKQKRLLCVGRLAIEKQFDQLIDVFARLTTRHVNWTLRIAGEGPLRSALQQQVVNLNLQSRVEFLGAVSDIGKELAHADAFALTSAYEGFPNALLEAMAVGVPCVTFDCPSGPREMSENGRVALLVPANDGQALESALDQLMSSDDARRDLGARARQSVIERYSLTKVLAQWDTMFDELTVKRQER